MNDLADASRSDASAADSAPRQLPCRSTPRAETAARQLARLNALLPFLKERNAFYRQKFGHLPTHWDSLERRKEFPFTFKEELQAAAGPGMQSLNLSFPPEKYVRFHQTSGTRGRPLYVMDTADDWNWFLDCWDAVFDAAEVTGANRLLPAFSYGPFIGFWAAHDAAVRRGCLVVPGGGMTSLSRLQAAADTRADVLLCTPSYALHLAEVARKHQIRLKDLSVRKLILAGEPGGGLPATRARLEELWNAKVYDHAGATEVGAWGIPDPAGRGILVNEEEFLVEFLPLEHGGEPVSGESCEMVLTNLGRRGFPVLRYRSRDVVKPVFPADGRGFVLLEGGVVGRTDDMLIIRGVNIFPTAIEQILRSFPEIHEYRLTATRISEMDQLTIEIEDVLEKPLRVTEELRLRLGLRVDVQCVPLNTLPRFEGKGKRFVDQRGPRTPRPNG